MLAELIALLECISPSFLISCQESRGKGIGLW